MGNRNAKKEKHEEKEWKIYVCRSGTVFCEEYNEWIELEDDDKNTKTLFKKTVDGDVTDEESHYLRVLAGKRKNKEIFDVCHSKNRSVFDFLRSLGLNSNYEVYVCRKLSERNNFHVWLELVPPRRPHNDVVHKFHMQIRQERVDDSEKKKFQQQKISSSPTKYLIDKLSPSKRTIFRDSHKRLFPPGEYNSYKVAVGYTNLKIDDIAYISHTLGQRFTSLKTTNLMTVNCRTYILELLSELELGDSQKIHECMAQIQANWGTGRGMKNVREGISLGSKLGIIIGSGLSITGIGIGWTIAIGTIGFWNPAKVGEIVGVGMIITGGLLITGGLISLSIGGLTGGLIGSAVGALKSNLNDGGFSNKNKAKDNVVLIEILRNEGDVAMFNL